MNPKSLVQNLNLQQNEIMALAATVASGAITGSLAASSVINSEKRGLGPIGTTTNFLVASGVGIGLQTAAKAVIAHKTGVDVSNLINTKIASQILKK